MLVKAKEGLPLWSPVLHVFEGRVYLFFTRSSPKCHYFDKGKQSTRHSPGGNVELLHWTR